MMKDLAAMEREYTVNNVKYVVFPSFREYGKQGTQEDLADKIKRLILSEDIMPKRK